MNDSLLAGNDALSKVTTVEDKTQKLAADLAVDSDAPDKANETSAPDPPEAIVGAPAEDATPLAEGEPSESEVNVEDASREISDTSGDPPAARDVHGDAREVLPSQTESIDPTPPINEPLDSSDDDAESGASDDTVTEEAPPAMDEAAVDQEVDDEEEEDDVAVVPAGPIEIDEPEEEEITLNWYILKVQSNRERSIAENLRRKIAIEGLDDYFGEVKVPTEKVTEFKGGKKKIVERKMWPGYIAVQMHVNDDTWFAIRETSGIGDFTGSAGTPTPMQPHEVAKFQQTEEEETDEAPKLDIKFNPGDKVKVKEGNFENFEGEVSSIDETHGRVTVMLSIFGRPTPVELEYWQVESL